VRRESPVRSRAMFGFLMRKLERYTEYMDVNSESLLLGRSHSSRSWGRGRGAGRAGGGGGEREREREEVTGDERRSREEKACGARCIHDR
jgi:hypothetical protein